MKTKFTKGEWRWAERPEPENSTIPYAIELPIEGAGAVLPIADVCAFPPNNEHHLEYMKANAKLISAAPEMLEVLQHLMAYDLPEWSQYVEDEIESFGGAEKEMQQAKSDDLKKRILKIKTIIKKAIQ